jgi:hypothetical protein
MIRLHKLEEYLLSLPVSTTRSCFCTGAYDEFVPLNMQSLLLGLARPCA